MSTFADQPPGFTRSIDLPTGRNTRALRSLHTGDWRVTEKIYHPGRVIPTHAHDVLCTEIVPGRDTDQSSGPAWLGARSPARRCRTNAITYFAGPLTRCTS